MATVTEYRGTPIEELTKEQLIVALKELADYYESRLEDKDKVISLLKSLQYR